MNKYTEINPYDLWMEKEREINRKRKQREDEKMQTEAQQFLEEMRENTPTQET